MNCNSQEKPGHGLVESSPAARCYAAPTLQRVDGAKSTDKYASTEEWTSEGGDFGYAAS
jgi:hypothetical protein